MAIGAAIPKIVEISSERLLPDIHAVAKEDETGSISPLGNASLAYKYNHKPDSTEYRSSAGQVVYTISNGWGLTAVTDEASGEALNSLLPRILARLDGAVGTKFLR